MLEKMSDFFEKRIDDYDEHMLTNIAFATEFYPYSVSFLPKTSDVNVLDLGCGTGLELEFYYKIAPTVSVTGIDLCAPMLERLRSKFDGKNIILKNESYFESELGERVFDAAISVESLHHFTKRRKIPLYKNIFNSLKNGGYFVLCDYFAPNDELEELYFSELERLKKENGIEDDEFYHYDTPLTVAHECEALRDGGFQKIEKIKTWENTTLLIAYK